MSHYAKNPQSLDRSRLPEPVFDENPGLVDFYWRAWELAWDYHAVLDQRAREFATQ